jgi:hypothetical protein
LYLKAFDCSRANKTQKKITLSKSILKNSGILLNN